MCGDSLSTLLTKKEQEDQEQEKPADVTVQSSREAEHLLVSVTPWPLYLPRTVVVEIGKGQC